MFRVDGKNVSPLEVEQVLLKRSRKVVCATTPSINSGSPEQRSQE
jgi:hypothetical protein